MDEKNFFSPVRIDEENFSWLARQIGLHNQDDRPSRVVGRMADRPAMARLFAILLLASLVYDEGTRPTLANITDLRRLADIVRAVRPGQRQRDITLANLDHEFRSLHGLDAAAPVSTKDLRELVRQVRLAKTALAGKSGLARTGGSRHVTHAHLEELLSASGRVEQVRAYLAAEPGADLDVQQRGELIWQLLRGLVTDSSLDAVLDLLRASSPDDLRVLFQDGLQLGPRLLSEIPIRHPLRGKLEQFVQERLDVPATPLTRWGHHWGLLDRPFRPWMIDSSLTDRADVYLDEAEFDTALRAAGARGWRRSDPPARIGEEVIRPLGLSPGPQGVARDWLARLAEAAERRDLINGHFSGDPDSGLGVDEQWQVIEASLRGLTPWQALELLEDANDDELEEFIRRGLTNRLATRIPPGDPLYERAEGFRARRLPGGEQMRPYVPATPFDPAMISLRLASLGIRRDLAPAELKELGAVLAGRTSADITADLPLNQRRQRALFERWWNEVGELALLVDRVREYLDGNPDVVEDDDDLSLLIGDLLGSDRTLEPALELIEALDDEQLARLFEDEAVAAGPRGSLRQLLEQAIPSGHERRSGLETLLRLRFDEADG